MRPASVMWFERLFAGSLAIGLAGLWLDWPRLEREAGDELGFAVLGVGVLMAVGVALMLSASRRRSKLARALLAALVVIGMATAVPQILADLAAAPLMGALGLLQAGMQVAAVLLIFGPDARPWFQPSPA